MERDKVVKEADTIDRIRRVSSRLIAEGNQSFTKKMESVKKSSGIGISSLDSHSSKVISEKISNQVILESNPHMNRAMEILTGLIVCPTGGSKVVINYDANIDSDNDKLKEDASVICTVLAEHFNNVVMLPNELNEMVYTALATDGAYTTVYIPDSTIDLNMDVSGLESEIKNLDTNVSRDKSAKLISLSRDPKLLLMPDHKKYLSELKINTVGNESEASKKSIQLATKVMRKRRLYKAQPNLKLAATKVEDELAAPIKKVIGSEAIRPIIFKGEPDYPYGYIVILDGDGHPVEMTEEIDFDKDLRSMAEANTQDAQIKKIANNFTTKKTESNINSVKSLQTHFNNYLEEQVFDAIIDGTYTEKFEIKDDNMISQIMFHRLLRNQKTRLLFLPARLVSYFCFEVDNDGVGRSLISKTKALSNIYTVLFYANFLGNLSSTIATKEVTVTFDEDDPDMGQTLEKIVNEVILASVGNFDFNFSGPADVIRNIQKHSVNVKVANTQNGDLPNMSIDVEDAKRDYRPIDQSFFDTVTRLLSMRIGFSPELIDQSYSPEFSSQVVRDNEITARQLSKYISRVSEKLTDHVITETLVDPIIMGKITKELKGDNIDERITEVMANLVVSLPTNDNTSISAKADQIQESLDAITLIVETIFPDSMMEGVDNMSADHMGSARELITSYFMSDYIRKNSSFRNIVDKVRTADGIRDVLDGEADTKTAVMEIFAEYAAKILKQDTKLEKKLQKAREKAESEEQDEVVEQPAETPVETPSEETTDDTEGDSGVPDIPNEGGEGEGEVEETPTPTADAGATDESGESGDEFGVPTLDIDNI